MGHDSAIDMRDRRCDQIKSPNPTKKRVGEDVVLMGFKKQDLHFTKEDDSDGDFLGQQLVDDNLAERVNSLNSYKPKDDCPSLNNSKEAIGISSRR
ncbi:hypothetical protein V6N13_097484 [Hibiscus sabdariffa]